MAKTDLLKKFEQKGGGYKITDASGRNITINKEAFDSKGLDNYIDDNGNIYDTRNRPSNAGRRYKDDDDSVRQLPKAGINNIQSNKKGILFAGGSKNFDESAGKLREAIANNGNAVTNNTDKLDFSKMYSQYSGGNFDALKQASQNSTQSLIDRIKQKIAESRQQYQPMRNQNEVSREQQLATMRESLANQGNAGGTGRQELLGINTSAGNIKNNIDMQEQNLVNQGELEKQTTIQNAQADLLRQLIAEKNRQEGIDIEESRYQDEQDRYNQEYADSQEQQDFENNLSQQKYNDSLASQQLEREIASIGAYSNDYMAEIQRRQNSADTADNALIPYLQAARNEKIAQQRAQADNTSSQAYKNAYNLWLQLGIATQEIADILGIPKGSKTLDKIKADYTVGKPYSGGSGGGSGGSGIPGVPSKFTTN
jgi:hypothetical protein